MKRIAIGYGISIGVGVFLGLLIGRFRIFEETLGSLISGLQTLPTICWLPLALLWFGLNDTTIIFLVFMGAVFSITVATDTGVKKCPATLYSCCKNHGSKTVELVF